MNYIYPKHAVVSENSFSFRIFKKTNNATILSVWGKKGNNDETDSCWFWMMELWIFSAAFFSFLQASNF